MTPNNCRWLTLKPREVIVCSFHSDEVMESPSVVLTECKGEWTMIVRDRYFELARSPIKPQELLFMSGVIAGRLGDVASLFTRNIDLLTAEQRRDIARRMLHGLEAAAIKEIEALDEDEVGEQILDGIRALPIEDRVDTARAILEGTDYSVRNDAPNPQEA